MSTTAPTWSRSSGDPTSVNVQPRAARSSSTIRNRCVAGSNATPWTDRRLDAEPGPHLVVEAALGDAQPGQPTEQAHGRCARRHLHEHRWRDAVAGQRQPGAVGRALGAVDPLDRLDAPPDRRRRAAAGVRSASRRGIAPSGRDAITTERDAARLRPGARCAGGCRRRSSEQLVVSRSVLPDDAWGWHHAGRNGGWRAGADSCTLCDN